MIDRYTRPQMKALWGDKHKYQTWLRIELLALEALSQRGWVPKQSLKKIRTKAKINVREID